jgi:hypothetical protein
MKKVPAFLLLVATASLIGCAGASRPAIPGRTQSASDVLRVRESETRWDSASLLKGDLDGDGTNDYALSGVRGDHFVVGIVQGPVSSASRHWTLKFPMEGGTDEALCSSKAKIDLEEVEGEGATAKAGVGINLHDDQCDAFHIFWDAEQKTYDWWRL